MSIVTYLGCNFDVEVTEEMSDDPIEIGYFFSNENKRKDVTRHFTTQNIFEIFFLDSSIVWINQDYKENSLNNYHMAQKDFIALCDLLKQYLKPGEFCEIYPCWMDEELNPKEGEHTIYLDDYQMDEIEIYEKWLIRIER